MANIYGSLGIAEHQADQVYIQTLGYDLVYTATTEYLARANEDLAMATSLFVDGITENHHERFKLPGGGRLQRRGNRTGTGVAKASGAWDVAYPLEDFGRGLAVDDVAFAYLTAREYQRHLDSVLIANANTVRYELLRALFNNTARTFTDDTLNTPTLTIQPLANGDSVVYPPVLGSETEATDDHYLGANYLATAISNSNDPYQTIADELVEHFGVSTGGSNILVLINSAETPETIAMTDVTTVGTRGIAYGNQTDLATANPIPANMSARIIGVHEGTGVTIAEWAYMPAGYMVGIHLDAPRPLKMRVDPAATGLGRGLQLVANETEWPMVSARWRHRFGFGCANRLNGVVMHVTNSSSYTIPSIYQ